MALFFLFSFFQTTKQRKKDTSQSRNTGKTLKLPPSALLKLKPQGGNNMSIWEPFRQQGSAWPGQHIPLSSPFSACLSLQTAHDEDLNLWGLNPSSDEILPNNTILLFTASYYTDVTVWIYNEQRLRSIPGHYCNKHKPGISDLRWCSISLEFSCCYCLQYLNISSEASKTVFPETSSKFQPFYLTFILLIKWIGI